MKSTHILLRRWNQPPCRNMAVKTCTQLEAGCAKNWAGTRPQLCTSRSSPAGGRLTSYRKTSRLSAMISQLTSGKRRTWSVSYRGIIGFAPGPEIDQLPIQVGERFAFVREGEAAERETRQVVQEASDQRDRQRGRSIAGQQGERAAKGALERAYRTGQRRHCAAEGGRA